MIASFEVDGDGRVRKVLQVDGQNLLGHVVVVQLIVAESHVDVEGQVLAVIEKNPFVDVDGFLVVRSQVMNRC